MNDTGESWIERVNEILDTFYAEEQPATRSHTSDAEAVKSREVTDQVEHANRA
jgi:hypothetical protein